MTCRVSLARYNEIKVDRHSHLGPPLPPDSLTPLGRLLVLAVVVVLLAQVWVLRRFGEPYPAVMMPGFHGSGGYEGGQVEVRRFETAFVAPDGEVVVPANVLLSELSDSMHGTVAFTCFLPDDVPAEPRPAPESRLGRLRAAVFPGYAAGRYDRQTAANRESLREWLRGRAAVLAPGMDATRAEIRWYRETVSAAGGVTDRRPDGVLVVDLRGSGR